MSKINRLKMDVWTFWSGLKGYSVYYIIPDCIRNPNYAKFEIDRTFLT